MLPCWAMTLLIDPLSVVPLFLDAQKDGTSLGAGSGFVVHHGGQPYLITNWHVVTGRRPETGQPIDARAADPDRLIIWHHVAGPLGSWRVRDESLFEGRSGRPRWREHPRARQVDVVAVPLSSVVDVQLYPLDLALAREDIVVRPGEAVSIIGFPLGMSSAGKFPIWKTGHVASDVDLDYEGKPVFLVDATTKPGMSGSPVVARRIGQIPRTSGLHLGGEATRFLGVYSGRIHELADVGMVWKSGVLDEIFV